MSDYLKGIPEEYHSALERNVTSNVPCKWVILYEERKRNGGESDSEGMLRRMRGK